MAVVIAHNILVEVKKELVMGVLSEEKRGLAVSTDSQRNIFTQYSCVDDCRELGQILCTIIQVGTCEAL